MRAQKCFLGRKLPVFHGSSRSQFSHALGSAEQRARHSIYSLALAAAVLSLCNLHRVYRNKCAYARNNTHARARGGDKSAPCTAAWGPLLCFCWRFYGCAVHVRGCIPLGAQVACVSMMHARARAYGVADRRHFLPAAHKTQGHHCACRLCTYARCYRFITHHEGRETRVCVAASSGGSVFFFFFRSSRELIDFPWPMQQHEARRVSRILMPAGASE